MWGLRWVLLSKTRQGAEQGHSTHVCQDHTLASQREGQPGCELAAILAKAVSGGLPSELRSGGRGLESAQHQAPHFSLAACYLLAGAVPQPPRMEVDGGHRRGRDGGERSGLQLSEASREDGALGRGAASGPRVSQESAQQGRCREGRPGLPVPPPRQHIVY